MVKLAVIGTFYKRYDRTEMLLDRVLVESTRQPDEFWMMCEEDEDANVVLDKWKGYPNLHTVILNTPRTSSNEYAIIPYSNKINWALDHTSSEYITYLDNNSTPHIRKYELMVQALDDHPEWGQVYCSQYRPGFLNTTMQAKDIVADGYGVLNYTQVMHRLTEDRWTLDMNNAIPGDKADAIFWHDLSISLGPAFPVPLGEEILDEHYMESARPAGM